MFSLNSNTQTNGNDSNTQTQALKPSVCSFLCVITGAGAMGNEAAADEDHAVEARPAAKIGSKRPKKKRPNNRGGY